MVCPIPRSGRLGFVGSLLPVTPFTFTRFARVKNWVLNSTATPEVRYYSGTRFAPQRIPCSIDHTGTFEGYGANPPVFVGDQFTFMGYTAPNNGVPCTPGCAYQLPVIINTLSITWTYTAENCGVMWSAGFQSNGPIVDVTYDDPCDDQVFCDPGPCLLPIIVKDACVDPEVIIEWCNLSTITLTFTGNTINYSNNTTQCQVQRVPGNIDFTLDIVDQNPCIIPELHHTYTFELGESPTAGWVIKWGMLTAISNFRVDIETGAIIEKTNSFAMQGVNCCVGVDPTPERGTIINPLGQVVWPYQTV